MFIEIAFNDLANANEKHLFLTQTCGFELQDARASGSWLDTDGNRVRLIHAPVGLFDQDGIEVGGDSPEAFRPDDQTDPKPKLVATYHLPESLDEVPDGTIARYGRNQNDFA